LFIKLKIDVCVRGREKVLKMKKKNIEVEKILGGFRVEIKFEEMKTSNSDETWTNIETEVEIIVYNDRRILW